MIGPYGDLSLQPPSVAISAQFPHCTYKDAKWCTEILTSSKNKTKSQQWYAKSTCLRLHRRTRPGLHRSLCTIIDTSNKAHANRSRQIVTCRRRPHDHHHGIPRRLESRRPHRHLDLCSRSLGSYGPSTLDRRSSRWRNQRRRDYHR